MIEPIAQRKPVKWAWLIPASKAVAIGAVAAAITLLITAISWQSWMGYTHEVYQEFATEKPEDGLRDSVGFRGELPFFWNEILESKAFGLNVLKKAGRTPYSYAHPPAVHAYRWVQSDPERKQSLFLVMRYPYQDFRYEGPADSYAQDFRPVAEAFVEAAKERGVDVAPVGDIRVGSLDDGTWRSFVRNWWLRITLACCGASLVTVWLFGGFSQRGLMSPVAGSGEALIPRWKKTVMASLAWWGRKPVFVGFGAGVGAVVLIGVGLFWVHLSDYRGYWAYLNDRDRSSGLIDAMARLNEEQIRKMQENMNRGGAYPNFLAANARSSFAMELYVRRSDDLAIQQMCAWSIAELIAKADEGLKDGGLISLHEQIWQRRQVVDHFLDDHPQLRVLMEKIAPVQPVDQSKEPDTEPAGKR